MTQMLFATIAGLGKCYAEGVAGVSADSIAKNCAKYGRLYDWATAMGLSSSYNNLGFTASQRQGICPDGWRIPNNSDWDKLFRYVDGTNGTSSLYNSSTAGSKLKTASGWNSGNGTDEFGFSALPSGYSSGNNSFLDVGKYGYWWSANQYNNSEAYYRYMSYASAYGNYLWEGKGYLYSVRCLKP
ncbi:MAG: hypothetical protein LBH25_04525 [Fibromonadaceae bacterium]|jgi:uncharacterized protein (TIGR02145 family)|nr:hypothetical protein [Fibromonadaceae bacterium]